MRGDLRLDDLSERVLEHTKLMNVRIPDTVDNAISAIVEELQCTKTEAVIALLNEGLDAFAVRRDRFPVTARNKRNKRRRPGKR